MKAIVLAAGKGTHLAPFSPDRTASLVDICGTTVLEHTIKLLREAGVSDVVVVVNPTEQKIPRLLGDGRHLHVSVDIVPQTGPEGIGGAILEAAARFQPGENFFLVYGDTLTASNVFVHAQQSHHLHRAPIAAVCLTSKTDPYGIIYMEAGMRISRVVEKPKDVGLGNYVLAGVFVLPQIFFSYLKEANGSMIGALERVVAKDKLYASIWEDDWVDLRYPWDVLKANRILMKGWEAASIAKSAKISEGATIVGPVHIADGVAIQAGAVLRGPCFVGAETFIGNNSLVREFTSVGAKSQVGFGVELKNCVIFGGTHIGRLSFLGDSVIGAGVDVGAGTMTINRQLDNRAIDVEIAGRSIASGLVKLGSFVGDGAVIGASNTLAAGTVIEARAVVPHQFTHGRK